MEIYEYMYDNYYSYDNFIVTTFIEKERQSDALEAFEKSKFELTKSLMILELITRTPILKK